MTGIERTEKWNQRIKDCLAAVQSWKIESEFLAGRSKIQNAIFGQRRGQRIGIAVIEAERIAMQCVRNFVTVGGKLREVGLHELKSKLRCCNRNDPAARKDLVTVPPEKRSLQLCTGLFCSPYRGGAQSFTSPSPSPGDF